MTPLTWRKALHLRHEPWPFDWIPSFSTPRHDPALFHSPERAAALGSAHTMSTVGYGNIYPIDEFCTCVMVVQVRCEGGQPECRRTSFARAPSTLYADLDV
jgi:hypothetical protein